MYKLLLILKYLRRKLAPMFAAVAVTLCTMMVIIVISVMGGFLDLLRESARKVTGDVVVQAYSLYGFEHYEDLIHRVTQLPEVEVATPVIQTFALLNLDRGTFPVQVQGIIPEELDGIVDFRDTLQWTKQHGLDDLEAGFPAEDRVGEGLQTYEMYRQRAERTDPVEAAMRMEVPNAWQRKSTDRAAMVIGIEVNPRQVRDSKGQYDYPAAAIGKTALLTLLPVTEAGAIQEMRPQYRPFTIVNEFKSGLYDVDANTVFVPFDVLQRMLDMHPRELDRVTGYDEETGEPIVVPGETSGRASMVVIKSAAGYTPVQTRDAVRGVLAQWAQDHGGAWPPEARTWEQVHAGLLGAVQNEKGLVTFLFSIISLVAVVMVATTFYMIVLEKTRDIGVLRAIGASRAGIRHIFLGYGFAVGLVGAVTGTVLAYLIVNNLNPIQDVLATRLGTLLVWVALVILGAVAGAAAGGALGRRRGTSLEFGLAGFFAVAAAVVLLAYFRFDLPATDLIERFNRSYGWRMWDPQTYFFDRIPDDVKTSDAMVIAFGAVISSVIGALIPAFIAARQDPVQALRYE